MENFNGLSLPTAALSYANEGFRVFPCTPGAKTPLVKWKEEATADGFQVYDWWHQWPEANIGLAMGGGLAALDLDVKDGRDGDLSYALIGGPQDGRWPVQHTPSGGKHVLFRTDLVLRNFARRGAFDGLDCRTDGGYILAAPSRIGGVPYRWAPGGDPGAPLPDQFAQALQDWSRPTLSEKAPDLPEPSDLYSWEVRSIIDQLGSPYKEFLREGESWSGDRSRDAYATCLHAFRRGWTLADMARIGPETILGYFGADAPHYARAPWGWAWTYTVAPAWRDYRGSQDAMFQPIDTVMIPAIMRLYAGGGVAATPGEVAATGAPVPRDDESSDTGDVTAGQGQPAGIGATGTVADTYEAVQQAALLLPRRDMVAFEAWLLRALALGVDDYRVDALLLDARDATGFPVPICAAALTRARDIVRQASGRQPPARSGVPEVFVRAQDKFWDRSTGRWITKPALAAAKARDYQGDPERVLDAYLYSTNALCEVVEDITYDPGLAPGIGPGRNGGKVLNTYRPTRVRPIAGDVGPWLGLLSDLQIEGGAPVCERLLDEMAYIVQNPGTKLNHGIILGGAEGIGKDSFLSPWLDAVGRDNVSIAHGADMESDFNAWASRAKVAIINEVRFGTYRDRDKIAEKLKPLLAAPPDYISINEKNLRPYNVPNLIQPILLTNHRDALSVEKGSRRYFAVWSLAPAVDAYDSPYFDRYWAWVENGGREAIYAWLLDRDVSHIHPSERPMDTVWLSEMAQLATDPLSAWIIERIAEGKGLFSEVALVPKDVGLAIEASGEALLYGLQRVSISQIARSLSRLGLQQELFQRNGITVAAFRIRGTTESELATGGVAPSNVVNIATHRLVPKLQALKDERRPRGAPYQAPGWTEEQSRSGMARAAGGSAAPAWL